MTQVLQSWLCAHILQALVQGAVLHRCLVPRDRQLPALLAQVFVQGAVPQCSLVPRDRQPPIFQALALLAAILCLLLPQCNLLYFRSQGVTECKDVPSLSQAKQVV